MKTKLSQAKVLVTGGAVRIGRAIVEAFAECGAGIRIHCHKSLKEAEDLLMQLPAGSDVFQADLCRADDRIMREMLEGVDILINNASVYFPEGSFDDSERDEIEEKHFRVNYEAPLRLMEMLAEKNIRGSVINLLDAAILKPVSIKDSYSHSKFLLYLATRVKAVELAPEIRVNGVAPGCVMPPSWLPGSLMEKSISEMPLQKAPTIEDVADACVFLAVNSGITGEIIRVDSGRHLL